MTGGLALTVKGVSDARMRLKVRVHTLAHYVTKSQDFLSPGPEENKPIQ